MVGDFVFLKVSPMRGVTRFGIKGKLAPRFTGPFEIIERVGPLAYHLDLPPHLSDMHNVFHVSMLRKYEPDPSQVIMWTEIHHPGRLDVRGTTDHDFGPRSQGIA